MNKIKKLMCLFLSVLMILSMCIPAFAIDKATNNNTSTNQTETNADTQNSSLKIEISKDKAEYKVLDIAEITVTVTNTGNEDIKNVSAEAVFNDLSPVSKNKSETKKEIETLKAGESISFTYKATLNQNEHKLNIFQKIFLWFIRFFNGGYTPFNNGFDNGRDVIEKADAIFFGKFESINVVKVWYENNDSENNDTVTRGEWILKLANTLDWSESINNANCNFNDITGHDCENAVQYASEMNVFDETDGSFYPDTPATREFAAVTAIRALQFEGVEGLSCADVDSIEHKKEVYSAIAAEMFTLVNNYFYPNRELTKQESQNAINTITDIICSTKIDENHDNEVVYTDKVIELSNQNEYKMIDKTTFEFTVTQESKKFEVGSIFLLEDKTPYKIKSIDKESGKFVIKTEDPLPEETFKSIDVQESKALTTNDMVLAEGVTLAEPELRNVRSSQAKQSVSLNNISLNIEIPLENDIKLYAKATVKNPRVDYIVDIDWILPYSYNPYIPDIKNCLLQFKFDAQISGGVKDGGKGLGHEGAVTIASFPVVGFGGVGVYIELQLAYTLEGKIELVYNISGTSGVHIYKNMFRRVAEPYRAITSNFAFTKLEASAKTGLKVSGLLELSKKWKLIDFSLFGGAAAKGSLLVRNTKLSCLSADAYLFLKLDIMKKSEIGNWLKLSFSYDIWNEKNSPLKQNLHFENLVLVPKCTYNDSDIHIGDRIILGVYNGEPIKWICVDIDANGPLMLSEKVLCNKEFDAPGEDELFHTDGWGYVRKRSGSNCWSDSNIRQWLNSSGKVNYSHCPPSYSDEVGFMSCFTQSELKQIKQVTRLVNVNIWETKREGYRYFVGGNSDRIIPNLNSPSLNVSDYYYDMIDDSIFLLNAAQYNSVHLNNPKLLNASSTYWSCINSGNNYACYELVGVINPNGIITGDSWASNDSIGIRPAFYLNVS